MTQNLNDLGRAIDAASDAGDEEALRKLGEECDDFLDTASGVERVYLLYFKANTHSAIISSQRGDPDSFWTWEQSDAIQNILLLRRAIAEPAFSATDRVLACQIRTNLANRLNALGRPVAANEQWLNVIVAEPRFAKALANRARAIVSYATSLYDSGHEICLLAAACSLFDAALHEDVLWESGDREAFAAALTEERDKILAHLVEVEYDQNFDMNQWPLGASEEERAYRKWCLKERLFLNPLNEWYTDSVAASDVLHLPNHTYRVEEPPRFPAYYNLLKQEYVSARYRFWRATHQNDPDFLMRDVVMLDSGEGPALGHYSEDLKSAFRSAYSLFDKIGLFLNDYFDIGLAPSAVNFRKVWSETSNGVTQVRPAFRGRRNWLLRGLYFLSKDLFDKDFKEVSEPDATDLARLRNQTEHRFLSLQHSEEGSSTDMHRLISISEFQARTLRLLRMAREAVIYLSLAMHHEEAMRAQASAEETRTTGTWVPRRIESFHRTEASG